MNGRKEIEIEHSHPADIDKMLRWMYGDKELKFPDVDYDLKGIMWTARTFEVEGFKLGILKEAVRVAASGIPYQSEHMPNKFWNAARRVCALVDRNDPAEMGILAGLTAQLQISNINTGSPWFPEGPADEEPNRLLKTLLVRRIRDIIDGILCKDCQRVPIPENKSRECCSHCQKPLPAPMLE
ncbi:hypothetical protein TWF481_003183 [Arthrobotrys musiformis]|uniref:BTB domain-containing protein n=1 Tax=Arthrobotrys musiformis TaxID=47236 RepID=A0AAV9VPH6_9PEZI